MPEGDDLAARKQLLLARSSLYRLRLQLDAAELRASFATPARGLALVKYVPIAIMLMRLVARRRGATALPSLVEVASVLASWWLARRSARDGGGSPGAPAAADASRTP